MYALFERKHYYHTNMNGVVFAACLQNVIKRKNEIPKIHKMLKTRQYVFVLVCTINEGDDFSETFKLYQD